MVDKKDEGSINDESYHIIINISIDVDGFKIIDTHFENRVLFFFKWTSEILFSFPVEGSKKIYFLEVTFTLVMESKELESN